MRSFPLHNIKTSPGAHYPSLQWVPAFSDGIKELRHAVDCSFLSSSEVKDEWSCTSVPHLCFHGTHRDIFTFMFVFAGPPIAVINTLSELGYKVVCSTGEAEVVWTLQREV
jgi:hypothetical protein